MGIFRRQLAPETRIGAPHHQDANWLRMPSSSPPGAAATLAAGLVVLGLDLLADALQTDDERLGRAPSQLDITMNEAVKAKDIVRWPIIRDPKPLHLLLPRRMQSRR